MTHKCTHKYADGECGRHTSRKLWNSLTGGTVYPCRTHSDMLQDTDPTWMDAEVANAILERDRDVDVAKGNLRVAAERLNQVVRPLTTADLLEALYAAARKLVAAENARKEILR